jgi:hypothetical protein
MINQNFIYNIIFSVALVVAAGCAFASTDQNEAQQRHQDVLTLNPVGYWPVDEGEGAVLNDLSVTQNNGSMVHAPWDQDKNLIDFTGAYQWLEIPKNTAYQTPAFSMGGWVFTRSNVEGAGWPNRQGMLLLGNRHGFNGIGVQLCIRRQEVIDVVSDGTEDVMGTRLWVNDRDDKLIRRSEGKPNLAIGQWHHLLYTFEPSEQKAETSNQRSSEGILGSGALYLNGQLIARQADVTYKSADADLQIGNDAYWWHQMSGKSGALDGSVRDMVWFDRALSAKEVTQLCAATQPAIQPEVYGDDSVVLSGQGIRIENLAGLTLVKRRAALQLFVEKEANLQPLAGKFLPVLTAALDHADTRLPAAQLLVQLGSNTPRAVLRDHLSTFSAVVQDEGRPERERAEAALALGVMGSDAGTAVPALTDVLSTILTQDGERLPRVEDLLRNAITRALLDLDPDSQPSRAVLGQALAKPLFQTVDLTPSYLNEVRSLVQTGSYMDALDLFRTLPLAEHGERFFSYKERSERDYTATAHHNGFTYKVGEGKAWKGVEKVPVAEYEAIVDQLAAQYPAATSWRSADFEHLYRVPITKISPDGTEQKIYLEGDNFVLDGHDAKVRAWSIFIDELGYIHVMGGQHNMPNQDYYIPGSWEKMGGMDRDRSSDKYPLQMYWVSKVPGDIESLEFVGRKGDPRAIPVSYMNYMVFLQSPLNQTYLYGRNDAFGFQCWGMYRFDATARRWNPVGGDPYDVIASARNNNPEWMKYLHDSVKAGSTLPEKTHDVRKLVWAWEPPFYNFCRDNWGAKFDKDGRLHVHMAIEGLDEAGYVRYSGVYAWSDDLGETFHRADGSVVKVPLTINPAPEHNADIRKDSSRQWWDLWVGLLRSVGYNPTTPNGFVPFK